MLKHEELIASGSCLNRSQHDEPLFVLCGRDRLAAETVREWARLAKLAGVSEPKIIDALRVAKEMDRWSVKKTPD